MGLDTYSKLLAVFIILDFTVGSLNFVTSLEKTGGTGPRIVIRPQDPIFFLDITNPSSKVLTCETSGDGPQMFTQLQWTGPDTLNNDLAKSPRHRVLEEDNRNIWVLEFLDPKPEDSGTYYCKGTYMSSDQYKASIEVKTFTPIKLEACPERQFVTEGTTDNKITCRFSAESPKVVLSKDNMTIEQSNSRYKWDNDGGLLINGPVDRSDAGVYKISIKSSTTGERRVQHVSVQVHSRPEIIALEKSELGGEFFGVEGEQAKLECKVSGNPRPLVYWLDPRLRNLTSVGGYYVNQEAATLIINRVNKVDDHGEFTCAAYNTVGTTTRKVSMVVQTRPTIVSFDNKTVDEGSEVTFECRSTGNPQPVFSIRKHGINQSPYRAGDGFFRDFDTVAEGGGSDVYIHRLKIIVNRLNFGLHYCNATNRAGTAERHAMLTINHKPDLSQTPSEQYVKMGKKLTVTCHIKAYPEPRVTWRSDNTQIINVESSIKTSSDGQTHIVTMMPPAPQQTAFNKFVCEAENKMGKSEQTIIPRYTTTPGVVVSQLVSRTPTTIKLMLSVPNDGGDRVKIFKYKAEGRTLDLHNPYYNYREDKQNETLIEASLAPASQYILRNLLPYYAYRISIRAVNDVGDGDSTEFTVETLKPTRPEPPMIVTPGIASDPGSQIPSEYSNGYLLKWSPPELDNGDRVTKYIIKVYRMISDTASGQEFFEERVVEQMNERPMYARLGPLEPNSRYEIQLQARNSFGDSDPAKILIYTTSDRPEMRDLDAQPLSWLNQTSTPTLIIFIVSASLLLVIVEVTFSLSFQIGLTQLLRAWCLSSKSNSVISDRTYA